jgi:hypothetical protein
VLRDQSKVFNLGAGLGARPTESEIARAIEDVRALIHPSAARRKTGQRYIRKNSPFDGLFEELSPSTVRSGSEFARVISAYRAFKLGASGMAIKSDDLWEQIGQIDTVLPNRRVILLTRDFRDNLVSIAGKHFGPVEPLCAAQYVKRQFVLYDAEYRRAGTSGYHVKFETLVERPRDFVQDVARHFGLTPLSSAEAALESMTFRPNKIAKWRRLPPQQLAWCEAILRDELAAYQYEPDQPESALPSAAVMAAAAARDTIKRIPQKMRRLAVHFRS